MKEVIKYTLKELEFAKQIDEKKNYLVDEVVLEILVSTITTGRGGVSLKIFDFGIEGDKEKEKEKSHKVIIKLKPKNGILQPPK